MSAEQLEKLLQLKSKIKSVFPEGQHKGQSWFFDPLPNLPVLGYEGTGSIMFVAERPTLGNPRFERLRERFYKRLIEFSLEGSHVTDFVKTRDEQPASKAEIQIHAPYFWEEVDIIRPTVVVALGWRVFDTLGRRPQRLFPLIRFTHYSHTSWPITAADEFMQLQNLLNAGAR
jgi:uracil-DNA glycosylase